MLEPLRSGLIAVFVLSAPLRAQSVAAELVVAGLTGPTHLCAPPGDSARLFVIEKRGLIRVIKDGVLLATPFLDLTTQVDTFGEGGVLGLAFHPGFAVNERLFVSYYTVDFRNVLDEYTVSTNPDVAEGSPVQRIHEFANPSLGGHLGGGLRFGGDGMLYLNLGNGGQPSAAQDGLDYRGKILRLDVDAPPAFIPPDNPFVGNPAYLDEIWASGFRNPWRCTFDRLTGELWVADVGTALREEINFQASTSSGGENYGSPCFEGTQCLGTPGCDCASSSFVAPFVEFAHGDLGCIMGGYVYRGTAIPALAGFYLYADYLTSEVHALKRVAGVATEFVNLTPQLSPQGGLELDHIVGFGEDAAGELYILDIGNNVDDAEGEIFKIVPGSCGWSSYCFTSPNSAGPGAEIVALGSTSIAVNDFVLRSFRAVPGEPGIFFYGANAGQTAFGDGVLCTDVSARLLPPLTTSATGTAVRQVDFTQPPANMGATQITAGSTWNFQYWFRDPVGPGGSGSNLSDAIYALFCP